MVQYSVYIRKKRANVLHSQRLCMGLSLLLSRVKRTRKVNDPRDEYFYRFEDMPQPKYGIRRAELNEITCNIVKFHAEEEEEGRKKTKLIRILNELKDVLEVGDDKVKIT